MKQLTLIRHAKTEDHANKARDYDRELKPVGHRDALLMGKSIRLDSQARWDLLISSGAARAIETARIVARELGLRADDIVVDDGLYGGGPGDFAAALQQVHDDCDAVTVVGHNPGIEMMASWLVPGFDWFMPTSAAVAVALDIRSWVDLQAGGGSLIFYKTLEQRSGGVPDAHDPVHVDISNGVVTVRPSGFR